MKHKTLPFATLPQCLPSPANPMTYPLPSKQAVPRSTTIKIPAKTAIRQADSFSNLSNTLFCPIPSYSPYYKSAVTHDYCRKLKRHHRQHQFASCQRLPHMHTFAMMHGYLKLVYSYTFLNFCQKRNIDLKIKRNHPHESKNSNYSTYLRTT